MSLADRAPLDDRAGADAGAARLGLILLAHGARDPQWAAPFERVAATLRQRGPGTAVRLAFLEFMTPDLPAAAQALVQQEGCRSLCVVPMFLGVGGHVRRDLPALLERVRRDHPGCPVSLQPAIGEVDAVLDAMAVGIETRLQAPAPPG